MARTENEQKKEDVFAAYERAIKELVGEGKKPMLRECIDRALTYSAPRYYVSYLAAQRNIALMFKGIQPPVRHPMKIEMYNNIFDEFVKKGLKCKGYSYLETILNNRAPSFYIEKETFFKLIIKMLKKNKKKKK